MNQVAANRLKMMLAAGKHRLEVKAARPKEERKLARAERVLVRYEHLHGPLTHSTPEAVLNLARFVAHQRGMLDDPKYAYWFKTGTVHTDHLPAPSDLNKNSQPENGLRSARRSGLNKRTRPSDGQPVGSKKFDYEEYRTRKDEAKAADPERVQREKAAERRRRNTFWFNYTEASQFDKANQDLLEERARFPGYNRLRDIWGTITQIEQARKLENIHLGQQGRIFNAKHALRVRGVGRAARLAGF